MYWTDPQLPAHRFEAWGNDRLVRCFVERPATFLYLLQAALKHHGNRKALVFESQRWTYLEVWSLVERYAQVLNDLGIQPKDRVVLFVSNRAEFVFLLFAIQYLGAIAVPVGIREQRPGLTYIMNQCKAKAIAFDASLTERIPFKNDVASLEHLICIDSDSIDQLASDSHTVVLPNLLAKQHKLDISPYAADQFDIAVILYTSGTTGNPKGAMITHANIAHSVLHYQYGMHLTENDSSILAVPASHVTGLIAIIATMVQVGGATLIMREFKAKQFLEFASQERMTHTLMVPAMYSLCLLEPSFSADALKDWRIGGYGGAPMPVAVIEQVATYLPNLDLRNAYGATETTSPVTLMPAGMNDTHLDSVGRVLPCADVRIMNDAGQEMPFGETGELWIKGPMVVPGYWDNAEATAHSFTAGYWHSGDLGCMDEAGFVKIFDRKKDMLNRGGFKIYSVEVENCLMGIPGVLEAAIVGKPCPVLGERVHAFIYAPNQSITQEAVIAHCKKTLADYKVPETITWLDTPLPRNANGKVMKRQLRLDF
jgi:long-chain acyl-CoA synthetase